MLKLTRHAFLIVLLGFSALLLPQRLLAADTSLRGVVLDPSGATVPGATVTLSGPQGLAKVTATGADGSYAFSALPAGAYTLRIAATGFSLFEALDLQLAAGEPQTLNAKLDLESTKQELTVSDAPQIELDPSSNLGAIVLKGDDLNSLPDNPEDLEADLQAMAGPAAGTGGGQIFIDGFNGGRIPPKSSIREIRINQNPFSAEYDKQGFGRIEILTKPGTDKFHGQAFLNLGNAALNSRNPFALTKPDYSTKMYDFNLSGPLGKRASFFVNAERHVMDETAVVSALALDPSFQLSPVSQVLLSPNVRTAVSPRIDFQLTPRNTLSARYSFMNNSRQNEGAGELSLASRAYDSAGTDHTLQLTETAVLSSTAINETRFQYSRRENSQSPFSTEPGVTVPGAFQAGGASVGLSSLNEDRFELSNSTSINKGAHQFKFGGRLRASNLVGTFRQGYNGAYTFATLDAYRITLLGLQNGWTPAEIRAAGGGASQFSITGGNPLASVRQYDVGLFVQEDWRLRPNFMINLGLRYETQTNIGDHIDLAPRIGFAWGLGGSGKPAKTVVRGGFGMFYDRVDEDLTLQALRLNGINQQQYLVPSPDFYPAVPSIENLAAGRLPSAIRLLDGALRSPYIMQSSLSVERQLPGNVTVTISYANTRGVHTLRSRNINALLPEAGAVYLYESSGLFQQNQLITNVSARINRKVSLFGFYAWGKAHSDSDGTGEFPANQYDLASEWSRAAFDVPHRAMIGGSITGPLGLTLSPFLTANSGRPFNITLGRDANGDSLFTDRPAFATDLSRASVVTTAYGIFDTDPLPGQVIIPRNYGDGPGQFTINMRLSKTFGFGGERSGPSMPEPGMRRGGGPGGPGRGPGSPSGGAMPMMGDSGSNKRYSLTFSVSARNLLNTVNLASPIGSLNSPLFGTSNALAGGFGPMSSTTANRRIEFQLRFTF